MPHCTNDSLTHPRSSAAFHEAPRPCHAQVLLAVTRQLEKGRRPATPQGHCQPAHAGQDAGMAPRRQARSRVGVGGQDGPASGRLCGRRGARLHGRADRRLPHGGEPLSPADEAHAVRPGGCAPGWTPGGAVPG